MNGLQRNAGTIGVASAVFLALLFVLLLTSGLDFQSVNDPSKALPAFAQNRGRWVVTGLAGAVGSALASVFIAGLYLKLRENAPLRAATTLLLGVLGSAGFALSSLLLWLGGLQLADRVATDQVAANHAYIALAAVNQGVFGLGNSFVGAALIIVGWAISTTKALSAGLAWFAYVAGTVTVLLIFAPASSLLNLASFVFVIVWLGWAGLELRR